MATTLRQALRADVRAIQRVRHSVLENRLTSSVITDEDVADAIERTGRGWVVESEGRIIGFAVGNAESGNIWALFMEPEHERRGHGRRLHDEVVAWLWSRGLKRLWLTTAPGTRAETFYEKAGWRRAGVMASGELMFERTAVDVDILADEIKRALDTCTQIQPFTQRIPDLSVADAYKAAQRVRAMRVAEGAKVVGRKIGFTNFNIWPIYDVHEPIWGYVYDNTLTRASEPQATCSLQGLADPRIEPEIMFGLRRGLRGAASIAEVVDAIEWMACGFEIVQSHFPGWKFKVADTVIDGGLHGKLIAGPPMPLSRLGPDPIAALESFTIELSREAAHVETGRGSNVLGSPLNAMAHLAKVLEGQGEAAALAAGEIVTTGTLTLAYPMRAGETWSYTVSGLPLAGFTLKVE